MTRMVEDAGAGQFTVRLLDEEEDELGELARKMNDTATYLAKSRQDLERTTRELSVQLEDDASQKSGWQKLPHTIL